MADSNTSTPPGSYLAIGEVLALLLEEFSDVTISKIRFLESQGLIDPERTPSGYRKFYEDDVELLRCILREQRENYLPLRVIKDRLDSGEIDPTSEIPRPRGIRNLPDDDAIDRADHVVPDGDHTPPTGAEALFANTSGAPAGAAQDADEFSHADAQADADQPDPDNELNVDSVDGSTTAAPAAADDELSAELVTRDDICRAAGIGVDAFDSLEAYGVISATRGSGGFYDADARDIAVIAGRFLAAGFDARHLRGWKVAVDREAGLFEQMIQPLLRQRNPQAREQAREKLTDMVRDGSELHAALMRATLRQHFQD